MQPSNPNTTKTRRGAAWLLAGALFGITIGTTVGACIDEELTLDTDCEQDGDCLGSQTCLITPYQSMRGDFGWCRDDGECSAGAQAGCKCAAGFCNVGSETLVAVKTSCVFATGTELETCVSEGVEEFQPDDCVCVEPPSDGA